MLIFILALIGAYVALGVVQQRNLYALAEKERIGAELSLATRIQADMLPNLYPAFPDRPEFDIYATMTPEKEVGGDFYDFFLVDDDHLCIVTDYNADNEWPTGSGIFLHCKGAKVFTGGCVAIGEEYMRTVLQRAEPGMRIIIHEEYADNDDAVWVAP